MSGRAYARNPSGALGGATDIDSFVPHRFRIAAPRAASKAKELAIRRAIQRRCKEKNWKKLLSMRHERLVPLVPPDENPVRAVENGVVATEPASGAAENGEPSRTAEDETKRKDDVHATNAVQDHSGDIVMTKTNETPEEKPTEPPSNENEPKRKEEALEKAKQQLQELEEKLATLSEEKHAKFQQLKDILIAEARAKVMPPLPKKRRVDSLGSAERTSSSPGLVGTSGSTDGAGMSLLGAPGPNLLRAQSFSGFGNTGAPPPHELGKDVRRQ